MDGTASSMREVPRRNILRSILAEILTRIPVRIQGFLYTKIFSLPLLRPLTHAIICAQIPSAISIGPHRLFLDPTDAVISGSLALGIYEPGTTRQWKALLRHATCALDVGANIGYFTLLAAEAMPKGRIIAFEPEPIARSFLERSVKEGGLENQVTTLSCALGQHKGEETFHLHPTNKGRHTLLPNGDSTKEIRVSVERLDDILHTLGDPHIDAIKIDVEGFEPDVIAGATTMISRDHPVILFEIVPGRLRERGVDPIAFLRTFTDLGYALSLINEDSGELSQIETSDPARALQSIERAGEYANILAR